MGALAQPALGARTAPGALSRTLLLAAAALLTVVSAFSCGGDDAADNTPSATATRRPTNTATVSATPTPSPSLAPAAASTEFEAARAMAHVLALAEDIGSRPAGGEAEREAADYIRDELASYGYEASLQEFPIDTFEEVRTSVTLSGSGETIASEALNISGEGPVTGALVAAGIGRPEELGGAQGKIALIERGTLFFSEKVKNAADAGAIAAIVYNNSPGLVAGRLTGGPPIPAVTISQEDGQRLLTLLAQGEVTVSVEATGTAVVATSQNVVTATDGCTIVAGGHYDSVPAGPGANDNGSGTAVVLEIARVLAARGQTSGVCFALFGSEEIGLIGSASYVAALGEEQRDLIAGMLNFDMFAVGAGWPFIGSRELTTLVSVIATELGVPHTVSELPPGAGSDHASFIAGNIPAILFNCFCDPNYHTANDRADFLDPDRLATAGALGLAMIDRLRAAD